MTQNEVKSKGKLFYFLKNIYQKAFCKKKYFKQKHLHKQPGFTKTMFLHCFNRQHSHMDLERKGSTGCSLNIVFFRRL